MNWCTIWGIAKSTGSVSEVFVFRSCSESFHSLYRLFFYYVFSFVDIKASGIVFFLFFFSYVFCFINSISFFSSKVFSFIVLSRIFVSVIAVMYFEISISSADIVLKLHCFFISISHLRNSSGVSSSVYFAQKKSPRLW